MSKLYQYESYPTEWDGKLHSVKRGITLGVSDNGEIGWFLDEHRVLLKETFCYLAKEEVSALSVKARELLANSAKVFVPILKTPSYRHPSCLEDWACDDPWYLVKNHKSFFVGLPVDFTVSQDDNYEFTGSVYKNPIETTDNVEVWEGVYGCDCTTFYMGLKLKKTDNRLDEFINNWRSDHVRQVLKNSFDYENLFQVLRVYGFSKLSLCAFEVDKPGVIEWHEETGDTVIERPVFLVHEVQKFNLSPSEVKKEQQINLLSLV